MTHHDLIAAFETLAEAPDGVKRLRELVLQLAVRGKLVPQLPSDKPPPKRASDTSALKRDNLWTLSSIGDLPTTWGIVPFANLGQWGSGGTPPKGHPEYYGGNIPWLKIGDLNDGLVTASETMITDEGLANSAAKMVPIGTLLVAMYGSIGKSGITGIQCCTNQAIAHCIPDLELVSLQYIFWLVGAIRHDLTIQGKGAAQQNISQTVLKHLLVPLPPLAEQHRIVARVDELMSLLDRLEAARTTRDDVRRAARDAALAALRDAEDTEAVEAAWGRIAGQMDALFAEPEDVAPLRQAVLQLAVRGRLVPQDPTDEPATELATRLVREKSQLHQEGKIPKPKPLDPIVDVPFALPVGWTWVRADLACSHIVDCLHRTPVYVESGYPAIRTCDVEPGRILVDRALRVDEATFREQTERLMPEAGDVFYSREGGRFGIAAIVPPGIRLCLSQRMMQFRCAPAVDPHYFAWFLNSPLGFGQASADVGGSASPHVNIASIRQFFLPLPPSKEQFRISARIAALMALCDTLEARLTAARELHAAFAAAAVHHLDV